MARRTGRPSYQLDKADVRHRRTVRFVAVAGVIALVTALVGGLIGYQVGRPDATEATIASIKQDEAKRDAQQIVELIETARRVRDQVAPVLAAVKTETTAGRAPDPAKARQWQEVMRQAGRAVRRPAVGDHRHQRGARRVARSGPAGVPGRRRLRAGGGVPAAQRAALLDVTARQGAEAATIWSVAATQLDQISVDSGQGHQHVFLDTDPHEGAIPGRRPREPVAEALAGHVSGLPAEVAGPGRPSGHGVMWGRRPDRVRSLIAKSMNQIGFLCNGSRIGGTQP